MDGAEADRVFDDVFDESALAAAGPKPAAKPAKRTAKPAKRTAKPAKRAAKPAKRAAKPAKRTVKKSVSAKRCCPCSTRKRGVKKTAKRSKR